MRIILIASLFLAPCKSVTDESFGQSVRVRGVGKERRAAIANCPGEESFSYTVSGNNQCNMDSFIAELEEQKSESCNASGLKILKDLLGLSDGTKDDVETKVKAICADAYANIDATSLFADITKRGFEFDNEYFSGGTSWNYEIQTNAGENVLKDSSARVGRVFREEAQNTAIDLPTYLPSFDPDQDGCDMNAAFCCWSQDRQARDNNGNCNTPYDSQCIDKDPGDNANYCYTDHSRSSTATHVAGGFSIFGDIQKNQENIEGPIHCHGFAWADDTSDSSSVYKGNNLFFVSMYDHMYTRGYVRNAPGSSMCGCAENMAVVTRADCTEIDADEDVEFSYDAETSIFSVAIQIDDIDFNSCQGVDADGNDDNNDLESYYRRLVQEGRASQTNFEKLQKILVGDEEGKCNQAIIDFLKDQGIVELSGASSANIETGVDVRDPTYENGAASGGGKGMEMPEAPEEFIEGGEAVDGVPSSTDSQDREPIEYDEDYNDVGVGIPTVDVNQELDSGEVTPDSGEVTPRSVDQKKCKSFCYSDTHSWTEKCTWKTCKKCVECD